MFSVWVNMLESRAVDAPHVSVFGRKCAVVGKLFESFLRHGDLCRLAAVFVFGIIQCVFCVHGVTQVGEVLV